jgi:cyclase
MSLLKRIIACLDVHDGRVVKGENFVALRDAGDPVALAEQYARDGVDEIVFLDISATSEQRSTLLDVARRTAERLFIPLTIGGGIRTEEDVAVALRAGADKVSINSAGIDRPALYGEGARRFGAQCIVASIDAKRRGASWEVFAAGGRRPTGIDAIRWAREVVDRGAGEILLTSIDRDGTRAGYDLELTRAVVDAVDVPVIVSGGAGSADDVAAAFETTGADAALVAGLLHDRVLTVGGLKRHLIGRGVAVRSAA